MKASRKKVAEFVARQVLDDHFDKAQATALAAYLLDERLTSELSSLLRDVQRAWVEQGQVETAATSAHELSAQAKHDIEAVVRQVYPEAKHIVITPKFDPGLVGGVRLEFADHRLDLSIAGELQKFKTLAAQGKD